MRIYIAGPVTGMPYQKAYRRFYAQERRLKKKGLEVINPMRKCKESWLWWRCMIVCIYNLIQCDSIYMLKGWQDSRGARIEHKVATWLKMKIYHKIK